MSVRQSDLRETEKLPSYKKFVLAHKKIPKLCKDARFWNPSYRTFRNNQTEQSVTWSAKDKCTRLERNLNDACAEACGKGSAQGQSNGYEGGYNDGLRAGTLEAKEGHSLVFYSICGDARRCGHTYNSPCESCAIMYALQSNGSNGLLDNDEQDLEDSDGFSEWSFY